MATIRGINSLYPCPICLVKAEDLSDLVKPPELRTSEKMKAVWEKATEIGSQRRVNNRAEAKDKMLQEVGLRDVEVISLCLYSDSEAID